MAFARVEKFKFVIFILVLIVIINIIRLQNRKSASNLKHNVENFPKNDELLVELEKQENEDKILWEDIEFTNYELTRKGPGEFGNAVEVKDPEELKKNEEWLKKEGFYVEVGNSISLTRALPEHRPDVCKTKKFYRNLPNVSVIVVFHNEVLMNLLRCVHSIYNRTPKKLLHEIILVNDNSSFPELYKDLPVYVEKMFDKRVKIVENSERQGLIKARMTGAKIATGEVISFLDSHMEVYNGWMVPLLDTLVDHPYAGAVPTVDGMDAKTYKPQHVGYGHRGVFDWNFRYQWLPLRPEDKKVIGDPYELACLTGGAYAIRRDTFFRLGGYDEGLMIWNGENYELCIKLWLCAGGLYQVPCARVVHLSKHFSAYRTQPSKIDYVARNLKRVAEVWLDDYKKYLYRGSPARFERVDVGDLTKQFELKASLKCKPFKYFLDIVAPDMIMRFPILPIYFASGNIQSEFKDSKGNQKCVGLVHHVYDESITLVDCPKVGSFDFALTLEKSIRLNDTNDQCLSWHNLSLGNCNHQGWDQYFKFDMKSRQIINMEKKKCLQGNIVTSKITLESCDENVIFQRWKWSFENTTALENFDENGIVYPK